MDDSIRSYNSVWADNDNNTSSKYTQQCTPEDATVSFSLNIKWFLYLRLTFFHLQIPVFNHNIVKMNMTSKSNL
jgi:hypothetical protein